MTRVPEWIRSRAISWKTMTGTLVRLLTLTFLGLACCLEDDIPQVELAGGQAFPLVGLGVGNLQHDLLEKQIVDAMELKYRLLDTGHASNNEHIIARAIKKGLKTAPDTEMHVVTKVWYTHLGYERTKISVRESLERLNVPNIKIHMMLHWPSCRDDIEWMDCEKEEAALPKAVKKAGPPPHLDRENAFKESWSALEDIFLGKISLGKNLPKIESIGVSNFGLDDLKALEEGAKVMPQILQHNIWYFVHDPHLMQYLEIHKIQYQAYNVMNGVLGNRVGAPNAANMLDHIIDHLSGDRQHTITTHAQLVLKWLVQKKVSVIPRTTRHDHLSDMAPMTIASMPDFDEHELDMVSAAARILIMGEDFDDPARVAFHNKHDGILHFFWWNEEEKKEVPVKIVAPGEKFDTYTGYGHRFLVYNTARTHRHEFQVTIGAGEMEEVHISELDEL